MDATDTSMHRAAFWPDGPAKIADGAVHAKSGGRKTARRPGFTVARFPLPASPRRVDARSPQADLAGMRLMARSAMAVMVSEGLTPGLAETAEPSTTNRPG